MPCTRQKSGKSKQAIERVTKIKSNWDRNEALFNIPYKLIDAGELDKAEEASRAISDNWKRVEVLAVPVLMQKSVTVLRRSSQWK